MSDHVCRCTWAEAPHPTWGACQRSKGIRIAYANSAAGSDYTRQKQWDKELDAYASARKEGIQPGGTSRRHVDAARAVSDLTGTAFQAG